MSTPYIPSNASEGMAFIERFCQHCERDRVANGTVLDDIATQADYCPILTATFRGPVKEWIYGNDGEPCCLEFKRLAP